MTADPGAYLRHCHLLERRSYVEDGLSRCRTVGDVWEINERLDAIDAALEATDRPLETM